MTVEEARTAKQALEQGILTLVQQYEKETTLHVMALTVIHQWAVAGPPTKGVVRVDVASEV